MATCLKQALGYDSSAGLREWRVRVSHAGESSLAFVNLLAAASVRSFSETE